MDEMSSMEGANPLLKIFPPEIWTLILNKIQNPAELCNVLDTDPLFRLICKANENTWMSTLLGVTFQKLHSYLYGNDILNCRQVCKRLKSSVDSFLKASQPRFCLTCNNEINSNNMVGIRLEGSELDPCPEHILKIVKEMRMFPRAKIVGGSVSCFHWIDNPVENCLPFFQEHGKRIVHLMLRYGNFTRSVTPLELLTYIQQTLETTPNVESLSVSLSAIAMSELSVPHCLWMDRVTKFLQINPLPAMSNMTSLRLTEYNWLEWTGSYYLHEGILEAYKEQLQKLYLFGIHASLPQDMRQLAHLHMHIKYAPILESLSNIRAPLQKVCLNFVREDFVIRIGEILQILHGCSSTLTDLTLLGSCTNGGLSANTENGKLQFPVLEKLKIEDKCVYYCTNYDFLLGMPQLRELILTLRVSKDLRDGWLIGKGVLKLTDYLQKDGSLNQSWFKECVIYNFLPMLRSVNISKVT